MCGRGVSGGCGSVRSGVCGSGCLVSSVCGSGHLMRMHEYGSTCRRRLRLCRPVPGVKILRRVAGDSRR